MISSIPQPIAPPTERALFQALCDLGEIVAAGWQYRLLTVANPYHLLMVFEPIAKDPPPRLPRGLPYGTDYRFHYIVQRFALPSEMLRVSADFHRRLFPALPGDAPSKPIE